MAVVEFKCPGCGEMITASHFGASKKHCAQLMPNGHVAVMCPKVIIGDGNA